MKKLILGIIVSIIFAYFSFKGIDLEDLTEGLGNNDYTFFLPAIILLTMPLILKSIRWGILLNPLEKIQQKVLFPITCVGFMGILLIPMRAGEIVRPYLISKKSRIPISSALATIFIERVLDSMALLLILFVSIIVSDFPAWFTSIGYSLFFIFIFMICLILFTYYKKEKTLLVIRPFLKLLPEKIHTRIEEFTINFINGFEIIGNPGRLMYSIFLSILIWGVSALGIYCLLLFQNFDLPVISAFVVLIITMIGISMPTAPGFVGNFQYSCIIALSLFNISKSDALGFSIVYHISAIGITCLFGAVCLPFVQVPLKDLKKSFSRRN